MLGRLIDAAGADAESRLRVTRSFYVRVAGDDAPAAAVARFARLRARANRSYYGKGLTLARLLFNRAMGIK